MQELVDGVEVSCTLTGETTYDRQVGHCETRGVDLGRRLILRKLCARCPRYDEEELYVDAQAQAGQWQDPLPGYCS